MAATVTSIGVPGPRAPSETAVLLPSGMVLIADGFDQTMDFARSELYQ